MNSFVYYTPTKVVFESGAETLAGRYVKEFGAKKVLVHYGSGSVERSGVLDRALKSIEAAGVEYVTLGGVVPNPRLSKVREGIALGRAEGVDFILAIGGGSVIDSSKAIALGLFDEGDVWDFFMSKRAPQGAIPVATILTLPAAGSEMSDSCVITNEEGMLKRYAGHDDCLCKFALMNPELTLTLPTLQTVNGCVDIMMHTMERYFNNTTNMDITDSIAEGLLKSVMRSALQLKENPQNLEARWNIMWAGSLAHNNLTSCGGDGGDWSTHDIEHELSGMFDVSHGAGLSTVWPSWARYVVDVIPQRFARFAVNVMGVTPTADDKQTALKGIEAMESFYTTIGTPISITQLISRPATVAEIDEMAEKATCVGRTSVGSVIKLVKEDVAKILTAAQ